MKHILFYGSGAVNLSLLGWIERPGLKITVLARANSAAAIREHGVEVMHGTLLSKASPEVVTDIAEVIEPDLVVIGVKAYALDETANAIRAQFGRDIPVLSVLNGVRHVDLLRSKFVNVMFATICYNAYRELPYRSVALSRGPIVLTSSRGTEKHIRRGVADLLKGRVELVQSSDAMDVACNKLIINLGNALMTMIAFHDHRDRELKELQRLSAHLLWEGVQVMKAHGVKEVKIPGMPSWRLLHLSVILPQFITVPIFRKKMSVSAINSMAQDVAAGAQTEIEELNGHFLHMCSKVDVPVPYNKAIYALFKEWVAASAPAMTPSEVLSRIRSVSKR